MADIKMEKALSEDAIKMHKGIAVDAFNATWDFIDKEQKSDDEICEMLNTAHASLFHWRKIGTALNIQRGEWMLARIYTLLKMPTAALFHASACLRLTEENNFVDFDLSFAHECWARANALAGNRAVAEEHYKKAEDSASQIKKQGDKDYFVSELKGGEWFGIKQ